ncbi:MAG: acetate uptake transporter [Thaumarchaeota archaeon]|nr:acetate uptake transporter [Nitrososphaerota archaeon]
MMPQGLSLMAVAGPASSNPILANPAPLGLMAFGTTTVLLNLANAGVYPLDSVILTMGLFYGGAAQIIAGAFEFRKGNTFGMTAFLSYGFFWESFAMIQILPKLGLGAAASAASLSSYLFIWGLFTLFMFFGTLRINGSLMFVFGSLFILFFMLAGGFAWGNSSLLTYAGYEGVVCGLSAMYASVALVLNEVYGKTVLPTFPVRARA